MRLSLRRPPAVRQVCGMRYEDTYIGRYEDTFVMLCIWYLVQCYTCVLIPEHYTCVLIPAYVCIVISVHQVPSPVFISACAACKKWHTRAFVLLTKPLCCQLNQLNVLDDAFCVCRLFNLLLFLAAHLS